VAVRRALRGAGAAERLARRIEAAETVRPAPDGVRRVEMPAHDHAEAGAGRPARLLGELESQAREGHDVVEADDALSFLTQDLVEVHVAQWDERRGGVGGRPREGGVVVRNELLAEIRVGGVQGRDVRPAELIDEAILQRAIEALAAPARLGRIGADVLDAQASQRVPELREMRAINGPAGFRGMKAQPARSVYRAIGNPKVRKTSARATMTACSVSAGQSCA
jgi:hypothetical protein